MVPALQGADIHSAVVRPNTVLAQHADGELGQSRCRIEASRVLSRFFEKKAGKFRLCGISMRAIRSLFSHSTHMGVNKSFVHMRVKERTGKHRLCDHALSELGDKHHALLPVRPRLLVHPVPAPPGVWVRV